MTNHTLNISDRASITYYNDGIIIRSYVKRGEFSKYFYPSVFVIFPIIICSAYFLNEFLVSLFAAFFFLLMLYSLKSDLTYLFKYRNLKEELKIDLSTIQYFKNGKRFLNKQFDQFFIAFNIENSKSIKPDYDENLNRFNPMLCIIGNGQVDYIMQTLNLEECISILDEMEIWYSQLNILKSLKIYRTSTNEITLYNHRYWKDEFTTRFVGGIF